MPRRPRPSTIRRRLNCPRTCVKALLPLFRSIAKAKVSRTRVEMLNDVLMNGQIVDKRKSTFQIASKADDQFTIYLKEPDRRTRLYCDGKNFMVALAPDAYSEFDKPIDLQTVVTRTPVILGPYPEPVLALSMAGVDPAISLIGGMTSLRIIDREPYRDDRPAIHFAGIQADGVTWDLWISADDQPQPLRMLIDLTPMLVASGKMKIPAGYSNQIRYDFISHRMTGEVDESLFAYTPKPDAKKYESVDDYLIEQAGEPAEHSLTGKPAPAFRALDLAGKIIDSRKLKGQVVIIDFWATWCQPCLESMPVIEKVAATFKGKPVQLLSINTGQKRDEVKEFFAKRKSKVRTLLDPNGLIADGFQADRIPQTVIVRGDGVIETVLMGFADEADLTKRLTAAVESSLKAPGKNKLCRSLTGPPLRLGFRLDQPTVLSNVGDNAHLCYPAAFFSSAAFKRL